MRPKTVVAVTALTGIAMLASAGCGSAKRPGSASPTGTIPATTTALPAASSTTTIATAARRAAFVTAANVCAAAVTQIAAVPVPTAAGAAARADVSRLRTVIAHSVGGVLALPTDVVGSAVAGQLHARVEQSFRDLDEAAVRATANDVAGTSANFSDAVDEIETFASVLRRWGAACEGAPEPLRAGLRQPSAVIDVGGYISQVTVAGTTVWTDRQDGRAVVRVDATTGRVVATIPVDDDDLRTIEVVNDGVWVRGATAMHRIDPATNRVVQTISKQTIGAAVTRAFVDDQAIWACNGHTVVRASKLDGHPLAVIALPYQCGTVDTARGDVWVASDAGVAGLLTRIDEATNRVLFTRAVPADSGTFVAIGANRVWTNSQAGATRPGAVGLDRSTGRVLASAPLVSGGGPGALTATTYIAVDTAPGIVDAFDAGTGRVLGRYDGGAEPNALAVAGHTLWVVDEATGELLRFELP